MWRGRKGNKETSPRISCIRETVRGASVSAQTGPVWTWPTALVNLKRTEQEMVTAKFWQEKFYTWIQRKDQLMIHWTQWKDETDTCDIHHTLCKVSPYLPPSATSVRHFLRPRHEDTVDSVCLCMCATFWLSWWSLLRAAQRCRWGSSAPSAGPSTGYQHSGGKRRERDAHDLSVASDVILQDRTISNHTSTSFPDSEVREADTKSHCNILTCSKKIRGSW